MQIITPAPVAAMPLGTETGPRAPSMTGLVRRPRPQTRNEYVATADENGNDACSTATVHASYRGSSLAICASTSFLPKPTAQIVSQLISSSAGAGGQLLQLLRDATPLLHQGLDDAASCSEQTCKVIGYGVRDIHACLVMVDDDLMEANLGETAVDEVAVSNCRQWLRQLQSFIMALQRDVDAFMLEAVRMRRCTATTATVSSLEAVAGNCCSSDEDAVMKDDTAATPWLEFLSKVSTQFDEAVYELERIQQQAFARKAAEALKLRLVVRSSVSKCVCLRSRLNYRMHWEGKVSL